MIRKWIEQSKQIIPGTTSVVRIFYALPLRVMIGQEGHRWHLSISVQSGRYPTWDEIADARYDLLPADIDVALILPPPWDYVNAGNVFHLWEISDKTLPIDRQLSMPRTYENGVKVEDRYEP